MTHDELMQLTPQTTPEVPPESLGIHPGWRLSRLDRWEIEHGHRTFYAVVDPRVLGAGQRERSGQRDDHR